MRGGYRMVLELSGSTLGLDEWNVFFMGCNKSEGDYIVRTNTIFEVVGKEKDMKNDVDMQ